MTDHVETLQKAREQMLTARRELADGLSKPFDRNKTHGFREDFVEIQNVIDQIDKAIADERKLAPPAPIAGFSPEDPFGEEPPEQV